MVRSVCTLHELDRYLATLYPDSRTYEDLKLGPLVKHPLVYEYFKFPQNLDPPEITTLMIMRYLKNFMNKEGWIHKVDMQAFLKYLQEQKNCETFYELGLKIDSLGLVIKVRLVGTCTCIRIEMFRMYLVRLRFKHLVFLITYTFNLWYIFRRTFKQIRLCFSHAATNERTSIRLYLYAQFLDIT
jgi:hypothetical protein